MGLWVCRPSLLLEVAAVGALLRGGSGWQGPRASLPGGEWALGSVTGGWESRAPMFRVRRKGEHPAQTDACRDGGWVLSLAHTVQGPREGSPQRPRSCTALGKKQAQDVSSGAFLFSNLNSSSRDPSLRPSLQSPWEGQRKSNQSNHMSLRLVPFMDCYQISRIYGSTVLWRIIWVPAGGTGMGGKWKKERQGKKEGRDTGREGRGQEREGTSMKGTQTRLWVFFGFFFPTQIHHFPELHL